MQSHGHYYHEMDGVNNNIEWLQWDHSYLFFAAQRRREEEAWFHPYSFVDDQAEAAAAAAEAAEAAEAKGAAATVASCTSPAQTLVVMWNVCPKNSKEELRKLLNYVDFEPAHLKKIEQQPGTFALFYNDVFIARSAVISLDQTQHLPAGSALEKEGTVRLARYSPEEISWIAANGGKCNDVPDELTSAMVSHALWMIGEGA